MYSVSGSIKFFLNNNNNVYFLLGCRLGNIKVRKRERGVPSRRSIMESQCSSIFIERQQTCVRQIHSTSSQFSDLI